MNHLYLARVKSYSNMLISDVVDIHTLQYPNTS